MFPLIRLLGYLLVAMITFIGLRLFYYYASYFFAWRRYRQLAPVTTANLRALRDLPYVKVQITTRGAPGTTDVIRRGIQNIVALASEAPELYCPRLSIEVITESREQARLLKDDFALMPVLLEADALVLPPTYRTPRDTGLKARALHYMVEQRRRGYHHKPGRTFIVHYDEESVMEPDELRKLVACLATTDKQILEGPIYYPLEFNDASAICRAMECNRPIVCYECRHVMEDGHPIHIHGSNLVVDEALEDQFGWDFGTLDGQPFVAEDYVFGTLAFLRYGPSIFGWHGCVMLEQPPFSIQSAFRQRVRWIQGVLQGLAMLKRQPAYHKLPLKERIRLTLPTHYRILTFALGCPTGALAVPFLLYQTAIVLSGHTFIPLPFPLDAWLVFVGFLWLNSMLIGVWYNLAQARDLTPLQRLTEGARAFALTPVASFVETAAGFWAAVKWATGDRHVTWQTTPKTIEADRAMNWRAISV